MLDYSSGYPSAEQPLKLGVLRMSALGDCLMLLATLQRIKAFRPNWEVTWFISRVWAPLFENVPGIRLVPLNKPNMLRDYVGLARAWRKTRFDVLLCMQASMRSNLMVPAFKADVKVGFDQKRSREGHGLFVNRRIAPADEHLVDGFERFADVLGVPRRVPAWHLPVPTCEVSALSVKLAETFASGGKGPLIAINPVASKLERTPYPDFYISLIGLLMRNLDARVVLVGGGSAQEVEFARIVCAGVKQLFGLLPVNWLGQTSLIALAACLTQVDLLIAPDTGPAHLANALGTPVVGLFAVAPPQLSAPYNYQSLVVNQYPNAVQAFLGKSVDQVAFATRVHCRDAMRLILVESVLAKVTQVFAKSSA